MSELFKTISKDGESYSQLKLDHMAEGYVTLWKNIGYTPLQVVEEVGRQINDCPTMTYVGRLDPMAEGWFEIVFNGDMELKDRLMSKDKTYEIEVLFGIDTDTGDVLGKILNVDPKDISEEKIKEILPAYVGKFTWAYPAYSAPMLNKAEGTPAKQKDIEIYSVEFLLRRTISAENLLKDTMSKLMLSHMTGNFRLDEIKERWNAALTEVKEDFTVAHIRVHCSSGTYMRTFAAKVAADLGTVAVASTIKRV